MILWTMACLLRSLAPLLPHIHKESIYPSISDGVILLLQVAPQDSFQHKPGRPLLCPGLAPWESHVSFIYSAGCTGLLSAPASFPASEQPAVLSLLIFQGCITLKWTLAHGVPHAFGRNFNFGTIDIFRWIIVCCTDFYSALQHIQQYPWYLHIRCQ